MANINEEARIPVYLNDEQAKSALKNLQGEADKWRKKMHKAMESGDMKGMKNAEREMKKAQKAANGLKKEAFDVNKVLNNLSSASYKDLQKTLKAVIKEQNELNRDTKEYQALQKKKLLIKDELKKVNGQLTTQQGLLGKLKGAAGGMLPAFGWAAIITGAVALGKKLFNLADQTMKYRQQVQQLTGETGKGLADLTAQIDASSKTFQQDFNALAVANHNFAESMGISSSAAQDLIDKGFIAGADASGEFLDRLREYGPQFKAAGIDAETAIAIMTQEVKSGIYSDKGTDAIKEATIAIREMTPVTRQAIDNIGISSQKLEADLRSGSISYFEAIQTISNKLAELPPQSTEVGTALADIFKGAGEDAGLEYITMLASIETSMDNMVEGAGETAQAQQKLLDANRRLSDAWSDLLGTGTGTFTAIKASAKVLLADGIEGLIKGIASVRDWIIELYNESLPVRAGLNYMLAMWKTGFNLVKTQVQSLWETLKLGANLVKGILTFDLDLIKESFDTARTNIKTKATENAQAVGDAWANAFNETVSGRIEPVKQLVETQTSNKTSNTVTSNSSTSGGRTAADEMPEMESKDPRIDVEQTVTDAVLEQSKLRGRILDNEQKAIAYRAAEEIRMQQEKQAAYLSTLDTITGVFGEESKIGAAALAAKQAWAIAETIINISKGTALTAASTPFPANIPMIAGFVAQVAGLVGTIKGATKKANKTQAYAEGKYPGVQTGTYGDRPHYALFNEVPGYPEMVVDGRTFKTMQMNYPGLIDAIYSIRDGKQPGGYADGKYVDRGANLTQPYTDPQLLQLLASNAKAAEKMTAAAEKLHREGTYTRLTGRNGFNETNEEYNRMKNDVTL